MMMSRLCAVLAILWTSSTASVDNRTKVYLISHTCLADPVCSLTELLPIACQKEIQVILSCDSSSVDNLLCQCQCVHNVLLFLILSCLPQTSFTVSRCIISLQFQNRFSHFFVGFFSFLSHLPKFDCKLFCHVIVYNYMVDSARCQPFSR